MAGSEDFPFCSDRCRVIDLGKWASGGYVISSPIFGGETGGPEFLDEVDGVRERGQSGASGGSGDVN